MKAKRSERMGVEGMDEVVRKSVSAKTAVAGVSGSGECVYFGECVAGRL